MIIINLYYCHGSLVATLLEQRIASIHYPKDLEYRTKKKSGKSEGCVRENSARQELISLNPWLDLTQIHPRLQSHTLGQWYAGDS